MACLLALAPAYAQQPGLSLPDVFSRVELLLTSCKGPMRVGICVRRLPDGEVLHRRHSDELYELASNTKLLIPASLRASLARTYRRLTAPPAARSTEKLDRFGTGDFFVTDDVASGLDLLGTCHK